jgi:hypothetical protein
MLFRNRELWTIISLPNSIFHQPLLNPYPSAADRPRHPSQKTLFAAFTTTSITAAWYIEFGLAAFEVILFGGTLVTAALPLMSLILPLLAGKWLV